MDEAAEINVSKGRDTTIMMHFRSNAVDCCEAQPAAKRSNTGRRSDHAPNFEGMSNERLNALLLKLRALNRQKKLRPVPVEDSIADARTTLREIAQLRRKLSSPATPK